MNRTNLTCIFAAASGLLLAGQASAELIYGLTTSNSLTIFDSAAPGVTLDGGAIRDLADNENLVAIDYRPATGQLYAIGNQSNVYTIDITGPDPFGATRLTDPRLTPAFRGSSYAFDFNPAFMSGEFARIITDTDDNRVVSGNTGSYLPPVEKTDVFYAPGDPNAGQNPNIAGIAYTNSVSGATSTQQFGIDATLGTLVTVANNAGTLNTVGLLGVLGLTNELGFDISGQTGIAYAALQNSPNSKLYIINLLTGLATEVGVDGTISSGDLIRSITVVPIPEPGTLLLAVGGALCLLGRKRTT